MIEYNKKGTAIKVFATEYEEGLIDSIDDDVLEMCDEILLMPDTHIGKSVPIGFVAKYDDKIIPNVVGVDIGCGVRCDRFLKREIKEIKFGELEYLIDKNIPSGFNIHEKEQLSRERFEKMFGKLTFEPYNFSNILKSVGTLGGGNHFIEICEFGSYYGITVHTGSRNLGKQICEYHQNKLKFDEEAYKKDVQALIGKLKKEGRQIEIQEEIKKINKDDYKLKFLTGKLLEDYISDMIVAQKYAEYNRQTIANEILRFIGVYGASTIDTPHNYIDFKNKIIHKGSINAESGETVVIPLNMRDGIVIAIGDGNEEWLSSAPHGAGRKLSRRKAKESINLEDFEKSMEGINSFSVCKETIDESPFAYKDSEQVLEDSLPTMSIWERGKVLYNFKAK